MQLQAARFIPTGAVKVADKHSQAVVYIYEREGRPLAIGYNGKATKPSFHIRYRSAADREAAVRRFFASAQAIVAAKAERKAKRSAKVKLEVGHILVSSWGYDQTQVDFYQVTKLVGAQSVEIRKIASTLVEGDAYHSGKAMPLIGKYVGEPMVKRVSYGDYVSLTSYSGASIWSGKPMFCSFYA